MSIFAGLHRFFNLAARKPQHRRSPVVPGGWNQPRQPTETLAGKCVLNGEDTDIFILPPGRDASLVGGDRFPVVIPLDRGYRLVLISRGESPETTERMNAIAKRRGFEWCPKTGGILRKTGGAL